MPQKKRLVLNSGMTGLVTATDTDNMYKHFLKFGYVFFEMCERTDMSKTDIQTC